MTEKLKPYYCPQHRDAPVSHEWTRDQYSIRGGKQGVPLDYHHHYYCVCCRLELCTPEEYEKGKYKQP